MERSIEGTGHEGVPIWWRGDSAGSPPSRDESLRAIRRVGREPRKREGDYHSSSLAGAGVARLKTAT